MAARSEGVCRRAASHTGTKRLVRRPARRLALGVAASLVSRLEVREPVALGYTWRTVYK